MIELVCTTEGWMWRIHAGKITVKSTEFYATEETARKTAQKVIDVLARGRE